MNHGPYLKEYWVRTSIAKGLMGFKEGERIPTIADYVELFSCSRGVVQNSLEYLENKEAIQLNKLGKKGTFLIKKDNDKLMQECGLTHLNGSMPPPVNHYFAGIATGICQSMNNCVIPFTFAFVQGSQNRLEALSKESYDFVVVTKFAAEQYIEDHPELEIAFVLNDCVYSEPYCLYVNKPNKTEIEDGMTIAIDPASTDQVVLTNKLIEGKKVNIVKMPFLSANYAFYNSQIDCLVFRDGIERENINLLDVLLKTTKKISMDTISKIKIDCVENDLMEIPVAVINKNNYGIKEILSHYLQDECVGKIQKEVLEGHTRPQFY